MDEFVGRVDGWTDGKMDGWIDGVNGRMDVGINGWMGWIGMSCPGICWGWSSTKLHPDKQGRGFGGF